MKMTTTGFIGLGIMGDGMVRRMITQVISPSSSPQKLVVWNRSVAKSEALKAEFPDVDIEIAESAKACVAASGAVFSMLSTPEASAAVFPGVLEGVHSNTMLVDCATLQVSDMVNMNAQVVAKGGKFMEAPVSGSKGPAAGGSLVFLCGSNDESIFNDAWVKSCLAAMGKASHFLGEVGNGTKAKLVVNSVMGTMLAAFSEGINLAESCGLSGEKMVEVFGQGACAAPMYALKGPKITKKPEADHAPNFPLKHAWKDMRFACALAKEQNVDYSINDMAEKVRFAAILCPALCEIFLPLHCFVSTESCL